MLTIVIPTRNRPALLELCLRSVYEGQPEVPNVIVSDNSSSEFGEIDELRQRYGFTYVRQSGQISMTDHFNTCLRLPPTPWMMLLHDDDELCPTALRMAALLPKYENVGLVVGGCQYIDADGKAYWEWIAEGRTILRGEDALFRLGIDFHARSPNTIFRAALGHGIGGFADIRGLAADYTFFCRLAYQHGIAFVADRLGRYRWGHEQATDFASPARAEAHVRYCVEMVRLLRSTGAAVVDRLIDHMAWGLFLFHAAQWRDSEPGFLTGLLEQCLRLSPQLGGMQMRARREYPWLFEATTDGDK